MTLQRPAPGARAGSGWSRCLAALILGTVLVAVPAWAAELAGRRVADVLAALERSGVRLIYSDDLVPPTLRVAREPAASGGIGLAREILAPHGLDLAPAGAGVWAVVAAPPPGAAPGSPPPVATAPVSEIVVAASLYAFAEDRLQSHTFLTASEAASLPKLADETLRAVHRLPGAASNGVSGLAHLRGGEENETQVILAGLPLAEPFHLKNFFAPVSVLDPAIIASLDVYAAAFPARWGERMSAVLDIQPATPPPGGAYEFGVSLFHTSVLAADEFAAGRVRWLVTGRRSNLDEVSDLARSELGEPRYADVYAGVEADVTDRLTVAVRGLLATDSIELRDDPVTEEADATYRNTYAWTTLDYAVTDQLHATALAAITAVSNDREGTVADGTDRNGFVDDERDYRTTLVRLGLAWDDGDRSLAAGVEAGTAEATYRYRGQMDFAADYPFPGLPDRGFLRAFDLAPEGETYAAWVSGRVRLAPALTAEAGLRYADQTYDGSDGRSQWGPRASLLWTLDPDTRVRVGWGRFFQPQAIQELQVEDGVPDFFPAQRADHLVASLEHAFTPALEFRIEAYRKDYDALRPRFENLFDPFSLLPELQPDRVRVAPDEAVARGLEVLLRRRGDGPLDWWVSWAWAEARDDIDGRDVPRSWEQRHTLNGGLVYARGPWSATLAGTWHSGWPTTAVTLATDGSVAVGPRNAAAFDDFLSVDLRAGYTTTLGPAEVETYVEFTNAIAHRNPCCAAYTVETGSAGPELVRDLDYWPRFVPNLGIRVRF